MMTLPWRSVISSDGVVEGRVDVGDAFRLADLLTTKAEALEFLIVLPAMLIL